MPTCPRCGKRNEQDASFCSACGERLEPDQAAAAAVIRKTVTLVFSDVHGSTAMAERLDSEAVREIMTRYFDVSRDILERHGGTVEKFVGDAVMAAFGIPVRHEDDAIRAVRAAVEVRGALAELNEELDRRYGARLEVRTGVNTGEVIAGDPSAGQAFVSGDPVNVAARLEQSAPPGEILIGEFTHRLVRDAVEVESVEPLSLKGKSDTVPAYRLESVAEDRAGLARRLDLPMIGREDELFELTDLFSRAVKGSRCELVTIFAEAGTGKTRLAREFARRLEGTAQVIEGRCTAYGAGSALRPLQQALNSLAGIGPEDPKEVARGRLKALAPEPAQSQIEPLLGAFGLGEQGSEALEVQGAAGILLTGLAAERPLLLVLDDLHWADESLLELLEYLSRTITSAPIVICCLARAELRERHPRWGEKQETAEIVLSPLGQAASRRLISNLLEGEPPEALVERVLADARGNPLFVEEILESLLEQGLVRRSNDHWIADPELTELSLPGSVDALLSARIDSLGSDERALIEAGAVAGEVFWDGAVRAMDPGRSFAEEPLHGLLERGLILAERSTFERQRAFRFSHGLVREAAYRGIAKRRRAELHQRFASWLGERTAARAGEQDEIVGFHLEQAYRCRADLGPPDEATRELGRGAARRLVSAGRQALARDDAAAALELLERAEALLETGDPARADCLLALGETLRERREWERADEVLKEAASAATAAGERQLAAQARLSLGWARISLDLDGEWRAVLDETEELVEQFEAAVDERSLALVWMLRAEIVRERGRRLAEANPLVDNALLHAERAGDVSLQADIRRDAAVNVAIGATPREEALAVLERSLRWSREHGRRNLEFTTWNYLGWLHAIGGEFERAEDCMRAVRAIAEELEVPAKTAMCRFWAGEVLLLAGQIEPAEAEIRAAWQTMSELGDRVIAPSYAARLGEVVHRAGRHSEALRLTEVSAEDTFADDIEGQIAWMTPRAKAMAATGAAAEAEELARRAVALAARTDETHFQGEAHLALAEVLAGSSDHSAAEAAAREALALFEAKGHKVGASAARDLYPRP